METKETHENLFRIYGAEKATLFALEYQHESVLAGKKLVTDLLLQPVPTTGSKELDAVLEKCKHFEMQMIKYTLNQYHRRRLTKIDRAVGKSLSGLSGLSVAEQSYFVSLCASRDELFRKKLVAHGVQERERPEHLHNNEQEEFVFVKAATDLGRVELTAHSQTRQEEIVEGQTMLVKKNLVQNYLRDGRLFFL